MNSSIKVKGFVGQSTLRRRIVVTTLGAATLSLIVCLHAQPAGRKGAAEAQTLTNQVAIVKSRKSGETQTARRFNYTPRPYPVDERGFSPVDKVLSKAYAREEMIPDDEEGSLNPYVLKVISAYPLDGSYSYHCSWEPREYEIYNGGKEDLWAKGEVGAKAYGEG